MNRKEETDRPQTPRHWQLESLWEEVGERRERRSTPLKCSWGVLLGSPDIKGACMQQHWIKERSMGHKDLTFPKEHPFPQLPYEP